ncbi:helix-turn-helix domain-containing protein [Streptomonospora nanhaiensis]|uniref:helix-turn-helix domain-containing protein n=1 Tax=Streptomonospora nanhaiensis TaxID=1323731 RepID=UPI001C393BDE|nr:helix-turn-helix transcriptional regulator [Streptomonospora nanhaiensis]MBV2364978.1 helix-turn-helix domain-containing protein [Streptomonospora nanhaiensis]MBX9389810.1 helix-turn-helix domain-containing protein [Streptomonospora nanhaiensis]
MSRKRSYSPTVRRRRLGATLRRLREDAGLTLQEAAERLGGARAKLGKLETSELKTVKPSDLDALLTLYGVEDDGVREAMHQLARDAKHRGWWWKYRDVFGAESLPDFEAEASRIRTYEAATIPGLLQVPEYAEAMFRGGRYTSLEHIQRQVEARMARREILHRFDDPPMLWAVIDEAALRRPIGGKEVMRKQFEYLLRVGQLPHINIQVLPFSVGAHAALGNSFTILEFVDPIDPTIVFTDSIGGGLFEEAAEEVNQYAAVFGDVQGSALSTAASASFIQDLAAAA